MAYRKIPTGITPTEFPATTLLPGLCWVTQTKPPQPCNAQNVAFQHLAKLQSSCCHWTPSCIFKCLDLTVEMTAPLSTPLFSFSVE